MFSLHSSIPFEGFLQFTPLSKLQQKYLSQVYAILAASVACNVFGVYLYQNVIAVPVLLSFALQLLCYLTIIRSATHIRRGHVNFKDDQDTLRYGALAGFSVFTGCAIAPFLAYVNELSPSIIPTAVLASLAAFLSFSVAATFAKQRSLLFIGSIVSTGVLYFSLLSLLNIYLGLRIVHDLVLYGGLVSYVGFVLYDTQAILYDHSQGHQDVVLHALTFYTDMVGLFVRLVRILTEKEERRKRRRSRDN